MILTPLTAQELILSKVYMKDGNVFIGEITRYESGIITIKTEYGTFNLDDSKVKYITVSESELKESYKEPCIVLKDGKVIPGKVSSYISVLKRVKVSSNYGDIMIDRFKDIALIILEPVEVTPKIIFFDDFNDDKIDPEKWTYKGNRVVEENGVMKVETTVTDAGGQLYSRPIEIDPQKLLIITRKVKLHYANEFFIGVFIVSYNETQIFMVGYYNYSYSDNNWQPTFGFFISKGGIGANSRIHREYISGRIEPVWDQWFDEKIIYNPATGLIKYFINNEKRMEFKVEPLPNLPSYNINLTITTAGGWWTGHYQHFDDLKIIQSERGDISF
jgi:hypothetical protein